METKWAKVVGYENEYKISSSGVIASIRTGNNLRPHKNKLGYIRVELWKSGKRRSTGLHRVLAFAFIPNPENKPDINHKDGNPSNNDLSNLEWCTKSENILHSFRVLGRKSKISEVLRTYWVGRSGSRHHHSTPILQYDMQMNFIAEYGSQGEAARVTGMNQGKISRCVTGSKKSTGGFIWKKKFPDKAPTRTYKRDMV